MPVGAAARPAGPVAHLTIHWCGNRYGAYNFCSRWGHVVLHVAVLLLDAFTERRVTVCVREFLGGVHHFLRRVKDLYIQPHGSVLKTVLSIDDGDFGNGHADTQIDHKPRLVTTARVGNGVVIKVHEVAWCGIGPDTGRGHRFPLGDVRHEVAVGAEACQVHALYDVTANLDIAPNGNGGHRGCYWHVGRCHGIG